MHWHGHERNAHHQGWGQVASKSLASPIVTVNHARGCAHTPRPVTAVTLKFKLPYKATYGHRLCLVGSHEELGSWVVQQAVPMKWHTGNVWCATLQVPAE